MKYNAEGDPIDEDRRCEGGSLLGGTCEARPLIGSRWCKRHEVEAPRPQWNGFRAAIAERVKGRRPPDLG
jgi:hypothetical protein